MTEWDKKSLETAEQFFGQGLIEFVEKTEFGTSEYQAVGDYFDLQGLYTHWSTELDNAKTNEADRLYWESRVRMSETKIALLEHQVNQNKSRVQGYARAYLHMSAGFEDLATVAGIEAKKMFPEEEKQQSSYEEKIYNGVFSKAEDALYRKRERV